MNPLKYVLTFTFAVFLTISLLANQNSTSTYETENQINIDGIPKVSASQAVSLFNFFKVETIKPDSSNTTDIKYGELKLKELFEYFIILSKPIY